MGRKSILCIISISLLFIGIKSKSQDLSSAYFIDNYTYAYRLNPAFSFPKTFVGGLLSNVNFGSNGNIGISTIFYPHNDKLVSFMHHSVDRDEFLSRIHPVNKVNINASYNIASVGFWTKLFGNKVFQTFDINLRNNTSFKVPYSLLSFLKAEEETYYLYDLSNYSLYSRSFVEFASGTSFKLGNWEIGGRAKFLLGTNKVELKVKSMFATLNGAFWVISTDAILRASGGGVKKRLKESSMGEYEVLDLKKVRVRPLGFGGLGGAIDLGARYRINEYIEVSAAVNDLGIIVWRNKVNAINRKNTRIVSVDDIKLDDVGSLGDVLSGIINKVKSVYEFDPVKSNNTFQSLSLNVNVGAKFIVPFYNKLSIGVLGSMRNSNIDRYHEVRLSLNASATNWLSLSLNTAYTNYGWQVGGMVNVYAKKFNAFIGTDSYYYHMTPQLLPVNNFNTHVVFGVNYLMSHNPFKKNK